MRILFAFAGGSGHLDPLVPIALAARDAGHTVAVTGRPAPLEAVETRGFSTFVTSRDASVERKPLLELDAEREDRVLREGFAGSVGRTRAAAVVALCDEWRLDVVVCDETDFGSMLAAELLELPYATVLVSAAGSFVRPELLAEPLNALRAEHGLPPDPGLEMLSRYLVLSPVPPGFRDPGFPLPATAHSIRPDGPPGEAAPPWLARLGDAPLVYFTLGTVFNLESGDLFGRVLAGLRELPLEVVATVGRQIDPAELGPQPASVHVERYLPQAAVLPCCSVVVSHGGSGTVVGALAHGLPQVIMPMGADQPHNAARCEALGVGVVLDAVRATPEAVREAVSAVLSEPSYGSAAGCLRDEIAALPGPSYAVGLLERLARERRPLPSG